ncbi:hypothetical protein [Lelliottia nimipressuralis]
MTSQSAKRCHPELREFAARALLKHRDESETDANRATSLKSDAS